MRAIGGVVDTVFDRGCSDAPPEQRNGFVSHDLDDAALESATACAIGLWYGYPDQFRQVDALRDACASLVGRLGWDYLNV